MSYLLALIAGGLHALSFSPFEWWPLLAPSFIILFRCWYKAGPARSFWLGLTFGIGQFGIGVSWVYISIQTFGGMPPLLSGFSVFVFVLILALFPAMAGVVQAMFKRWGTVSRYCVIMPVAYLVFEWLRGWIFSGLPWLTTGYAMLPTPLSGLAPVGGVYLVSLVTLVSAGSLIALISVVNRKSITLLILLFAVWGGAWNLDHRPWTKDNGVPINVAVIQNNVPLLNKWDTNSRSAIISDYLAASDNHLDKDLIVWPEGAIPDYIENLTAKFWQQLQNHPADFAFGALHRPEPGIKYYNSLVAVSDNVSIYSKQHLVPFGEFFPLQKLLAPVLQYLTIPMADFAPWSNLQAPLPVAGILMASSICYEDAFPNEWRNQVPAAGVLLNVSEDMWFGNSLAPHQRLQMAQFRARETERPMVRSSNNGLSSLLNWRGEVEEVAPQFVQAVVQGAVQPRTGITPYVQFGDYPALLAGLLLLLPGLLFGYRSR